MNLPAEALKFCSLPAVIFPESKWRRGLCRSNGSTAVVPRLSLMMSTAQSAAIKNSVPLKFVLRRSICYYLIMFRSV